MLAWPSSLRVRLALWHSILLGLPLGMFAIICYVAFSRALVAGTDRFIGEAFSAFTRELGAERRTGLSTRQAMITTVHEVRFLELPIMILDSAWTVVAMVRQDSAGRKDGSESIEGQVVRLVRRQEPREAPLLHTLETPRGTFRVRAQRLAMDDVSFVLAGWYPLREAEHTMEGIRRMFAVAIPLLIVAAAMSGYFLARRNLAPVAAMARHAAEIRATNLHERLPVAGGDELVQLAQVVNGLLDRLQESFDQQRRFMADASHELRTPTAIVRTEADVTLSRPHRKEAEYRESIGIMQEAARRLTRIVDDLFLLARADAGHLMVRPASIHLEDVVDDTIRSVRPLAARRGVRVELVDVVEGPVTGDADLLGRLLLNLLDNAVKHSPTGEVVSVRLFLEDTRVHVDVADRGPGIPPEARTRVFERFFRIDAARTRDENSHTSGAGLGLAIARRIAEAHHGCVELLDAQPGSTVFRLSLPIDETRSAG